MDLDEAISRNNHMIHTDGLCRTFSRGKEEICAIRNVTLDVDAGEFVTILGPSGSGKSTLLHLLGGIDRPTAGKLHVNGLNLGHASENALTAFRRDNIGFVFQFYNLLPSLNALDNTILPLLARGMGWKAARQAGLEILVRVGLEERIRHKPAELSGGEQQRVAIARAMVVKPCVVLADEPTGDLDSASAEGVMQLMRELNIEFGITFVVATHNLLFLQAASSAYELMNGGIFPRARL